MRCKECGMQRIKTLGGMKRHLGSEKCRILREWRMRRAAFPFDCVNCKSWMSFKTKDGLCKGCRDALNRDDDIVHHELTEPVICPVCKGKLKKLADIIDHWDCFMKVE